MLPLRTMIIPSRTLLEKHADMMRKLMRKGIFHGITRTMPKIIQGFIDSEPASIRMDRAVSLPFVQVRRGTDTNYRNGDVGTMDGIVFSDEFKRFGLIDVIRILRLNSATCEKQQNDNSLNIPNLLKVSGRLQNRISIALGAEGVRPKWCYSGILREGDTPITPIALTGDLHYSFVL